MKALGFSFIARLSVVVFIITGFAFASATAQSKSSAVKSAAVKRKAKARSNARALAAAEVREAERLLSELGYWTGPIDGKFDAATRHALVAFQKVEGRKITGRLTAEEIEALRSAQPPAPRYTGYGHIEVDLSRQVLFVVEDDGSVSTVLPISSGNGEEFTSEGWTRRAITPTGRFIVSRKVVGVRKAPLGLLYNPLYFLSGVAIHGSPSVPARPASHGCVRIPIFASKKLNEMIPVGTTVIVHDGDPSRQIADRRLRDSLQDTRAAQK